MLLWPWARYYAPWVAGPTYSFEPVNAAHAHYWTTRYPTIALVEMMALVDHVRDAPLEQLRVPALVLYDPRDRIVDAGRIEATAARLGRNTGKKPARLLALQNTQDPQRHVLAGDVLSPNTTDTVAAQILDFLRGVLGSGRGEAQDQHDHSDHEQDE
jgi:pimeloyl-ACP methyl ester carboxylesterase